MKEGNGVFIGARTLSEEQVKLIVPTYDNIINQIEEIRGEAEKIFKNKESNEKKQHNNTIGLFGERGTGKTSTMYTILNKLESTGDWDIVLPIIEPDTYGDSTKILGAILGVLKEYMKQLEKDIKENKGKDTEFSDFFRDCKFKENNKLEKSYNDMLEYYCYKDPEYRKLLIKNYSDMETYKDKYSYLLAPDYEFNKKLKSFIENMVNVKRKLNNDKEPLIIITIDDIDLKTNKCKELIDSVIQNTCHPNIVCFLLGDYEILSESMTLALLESEELAKTGIVYSKEVFDSEYNLITRKKYLSHEYLKKVLPPAFRHSVVKWDLKSIPNFSFQIEGESKVVYLHEKLDELFDGDSIFKVKLSSDNNEEFLTQIPYIIFDKTPRGLINVFYYLSKLDKKILADSEKKFEYVKSLVDTIVASSSYLTKNQKCIYGEYLIWGVNEKNTVLNFERLYAMTLKYELVNSDEKTIKIYIERYTTLFVLLQTVKDLLSNANHLGYRKSKKYFLYLYNFNDNGLNKKNIESCKLEFVKLIQKIGIFKEVEKCCINEVLYNTDFKFALVFLEKMKKIVNTESVYEAQLSEKDKYEMFLILYNLIVNEKNKKLIKTWFLEIKDYRYTLTFLDLYSREASKNEFVEELLDNYEFKANKNSNINIECSEYQQHLLQEPEKRRYTYHFNEINSDSIYKRYKKHLFYNYIKNEEYEKDIKNTKNNDTLKMLKILNSNENLDIKNKNKIDKVLRKTFHNDVNTLLNNSKNVDISSGKLEDEFRKSIINIDDTIVQGRTKMFIKNIIFKEDMYSQKIIIENYIKIYEKLYYLGYMSTAWYGVSEARKLLEVLKSEAFLEPIDTIYNDIMEEYIKYRKTSCFETYEREDKEKIKGNMKQLLEESFDEAKKEEETFYKGFELLLPDENDINKTGEY